MPGIEIMGEALVTAVGGIWLFFLPLLIFIILGLFGFNYFQKKFKWKWLGSTAASILVWCFALLALFNLIVLFNAFSSTDISQIPLDVRAQIEFQNDQPNFILLVLQALLHSLIVSVILTLILMPFAFLGLLTFELLQKRMKGIWPRIIITCIIWSYILSLLLILFPWILTGLTYLAFFGL